MGMWKLPPGADVLAIRSAEMVHNMRTTGNRFLLRGGEVTWYTFQALAARTVAAIGVLVPVADREDSGLWAQAEGLRTNVDAMVGEGEFNLGYPSHYRAFDFLVLAILAVERRLEIPPPLDDAFAKIEVEINVDGFGHRHPERLYVAMEEAVLRVLAAEARIANLPAPTAATGN